MKTKLILLGGVPGTGKTTIAYNLALKLGIDKVVSIDMIKAFTKAYKSRFSRYVFTTTHEAYKLDGISVIDGYVKHAKVINSIILKVIENIKDNVIIIEGSTIDKEFVKEIDRERYDVVYVNLYLSTEELIERYKKKEKLRKSNWIENIKNIEEINNYLKKDNFNIVNDNLENTVDRIVEYVKEVLYV